MDYAAPIGSPISSARTEAHESKLRQAGADLLCLAMGVALTLLVRGYQFGQSNHAVYLPPALHEFDPQLLRNDWFTVGTLQYHGVFTRLSAVLLRMEIIRPVFLLGYLGLAILLHVGWLQLTRVMGGSRQAYVLSVGLFYLSAGGLALGMYEFLQDGAFLPSNIANVAMLWGVLGLLKARPYGAASCLGLAGLFHLNHALVAVTLWGVFAAGGLGGRWAVSWGHRALSSLILLGLCGFTLLPTLSTVLAKTNTLPLREFIDLYVRLRHPHHYDPSSWPWYLWVAFLWPMPFAGALFHWPQRAAGRILLYFLGLQVVALALAGWIYISEPLVQMSLYRFSIYVKLLSCLVVACWLCSRRTHWRGLSNSVAWLVPGGLLTVCAAILLTRHTSAAGLWPMPRDESEYRSLCAWSRVNTPVDAVFLVPPEEQSFRWHARRAIVVNFKGVPQLSAELPEWRRRLEAVLGMQDLLQLPRRFDRTSEEIRRRYDALPIDHLLRVARQYKASHMVIRRREDLPSLQLVHRSGVYHLYRIASDPSSCD